jgi:hypothetical protein
MEIKMMMMMRPRIYRLPVSIVIFQGPRTKTMNQGFTVITIKLLDFVHRQNPLEGFTVPVKTTACALM